MDGQQAHGLAVDRHRGQQAARFQRAHHAVRRDVAPAVALQRHGQQGAQIGQHRQALGGGRGGDEAGQHVAIVVNRLQRVVRRQAVEPAFPARQRGGNALQLGRQQLGLFQQRAPRLGQFALQQGQLHQAGVTQAKQRRAQRPRQRQIMLRRHQHIEQRHQIEHFAAVDQIGFFTNLGRNVQRPQFLLQRQQTGASARQHHQLRGLQASGHLPGNPGGGLTRF